jgi:hypothetical protein
MQVPSSSAQVAPAVGNMPIDDELYAGSAVERASLWRRYLPRETFDDATHGPVLRALTDFSHRRWEVE